MFGLQMERCLFKLKNLLIFLQVLGGSFLYSYGPLCRDRLLLPANSLESEVDILLDLERDRARLLLDLKKKYISRVLRRPFREREELRYFLQKEFGSNWLEEGKGLLKHLALRSQVKESFSSEQRLLADGTLLFLRLDWAFENADVLDDLARKNRIEEEMRIALLEVEIDERRKSTNYSPLLDRIYSDERILEMQGEWNQAEASIISIRAHMQEISSLLKVLANTQNYPASFTDLGSQAPNIEEYWRGLSYSETPY